MAGSYIEGASKILSGVYTLIKAAIAGVTRGARGIVSYPFTSDWGEINVLKPFTTSGGFSSEYNAQKSVLTVAKIFAHAYKGSPQKVLAYRMATSAALKGEVTLPVTAGTAWVLETLYESARAFQAIVRVNPAGGYYFEITEDSVKLMSETFTTVADFESIIGLSDYVRVKTTGSDIPDVTAGIAFAGGNNGNVVTATEYTAYLDALEGDATPNAFSLDGLEDDAIITTTVAWVKRVKDEGLRITFVNGGPAAWDTAIASAHAKSTTYNHNNIVNVGNGVDGYTAAEMAIFIAARVASVPLNRTLTDETIDYSLVNKNLKPGEREVAKTSGTLVFVQNGDFVEIDEGVNTLTAPPENLSAEFGKIRINNAMDQIATDLEVFGNEYKKKLSNTEAARTTYAAAVEETYLKGMAALEVIQPGYFYEPDPEYHGADAVFVPKIDEAFFHSDITPVDSMERIYQKLGVKFS